MYKRQIIYQSTGNPKLVNMLNNLREQMYLELDIGKARRIGDFRNAVDARAVDITKRIVAEHVAQRADSQLPFEEFGPGFADARYEFDIVVEYIHRGKYSESRV